MYAYISHDFRLLLSSKMRVMGGPLWIHSTPQSFLTYVHLIISHHPNTSKPQFLDEQLVYKVLVQKRMHFCIASPHVQTLLFGAIRLKGVKGPCGIPSALRGTWGLPMTL